MRHTRIFTSILLIGLIIPLLVNNSVQGSPSTQKNLFHESPNDIELVSHLGGTTSSVYVQGEYAYLGIGPELAILDISDIHNPIRKGAYLFPNSVKDVYLFDDLAYIFFAQNSRFKWIYLCC
jgi:hypothetical protein